MVESFGGGHWLSHLYTIDQTYDADGRAGKHVESRHSEDENGVVEDYTETRHQLRSSVLGGALIVEIDEWGNRWMGHVYVGGELLADYQYLAPYTITTIQHRNPTTSQWVKNAVRTELDPLGADMGYVNPYAYNLSYADMMGSDNLYYIRGNAMDIRGGCALDGMPISCSELRERESSPLSTVSQEVTLTDNTVIAVPVRSEGPGIVITWVPDPLATLTDAELNELLDSADPNALLNLLGDEELGGPPEPQDTPKSCVFNLNIVNKSALKLSRTALKVIEDEGNRIFQTAGHSLVVNQPDKATHAGFNFTLTIFERFDRNYPARVSRLPTTLAVTPLGRDSTEYPV
jgi:hypothetical protein